MTVKDFFENFKDKGGSIIRLVADDGNFDVRIGYNHIDKKHPMWSNFIAMYGDYLVTEWYVEQGFLVVRVKEDKGEGKFDYNVSYNVKEWYDEVRESCRNVHKSELADALEDIFKWGGYNVKISCVERKEG
jgi:hypothetical protein